jgi:hypothetical protein
MPKSLVGCRIHKEGWDGSGITVPIIEATYHAAKENVQDEVEWPDFSSSAHKEGTVYFVQLEDFGGRGVFHRRV